MAIKMKLHIMIQQLHIYMICLYSMMQYMEDIWLIWLYHIYRKHSCTCFRLSQKYHQTLPGCFIAQLLHLTKPPWIIDCSGSQVLGNVGPPSRSSARCVFSSWSIAALSWFPTAGHVTGKPRKQKDSTVQTLTNLELQWTTNNERKSRD